MGNVNLNAFYMHVRSLELRNLKAEISGVKIKDICFDSRHN